MTAFATGLISTSPPSEDLEAGQYVLEGAEDAGGTLKRSELKRFEAEHSVIFFLL